MISVLDFEATVIASVIVSLLAMIVIVAGFLIFGGKRGLEERAERLRLERQRSRFSDVGARRVKKQPFYEKLLLFIVDWLQGRIKTIAGKNEDLNNQMAIAGIRTQYARVYFFAAKIGLPLFGLICVLIYDSLYYVSVFDFQSYLMLLIGIPIACFFVPNVWLAQKKKQRRKQIQRHWGEALDLLVICVEAGLSMEASLRRVSFEMAATSPIIANEMVITFAELTLLSSRREAYANLAKRTDVAPVRATAVALIQAEKQGAAIGRSLRSIATANREDLVAEADSKAASLGPKLTVPMIIFFLPVLFVVMLTPIFLENLK
jgi:tight adherence protein C